MRKLYIFVRIPVLRTQLTLLIIFDHVTSWPRDHAELILTAELIFILYSFISFQSNTQNGL